MQHIAARKTGGGSHDNLKKLGRNQSATNVRKNGSHVSLKRNQSSGDVSATGKRMAAKQAEAEGKRASEEVQEHAAARRKKDAGVQFEMGDEDEEDEEEDDDEDEGEEGENDGWEEASSSASPALSRSASRPNSAKVSANNSEPQSPLGQTFKNAPVAVGQHGREGSQTTIQAQYDGPIEDKRPAPQHPAADAKIITERLLQRVPSHQTTKMSLATAHPSQSKPSRPSDSTTSSHTPTSNGPSQYGSKEEVTSRFVSGSGTPHEQSYLPSTSARTSSSTSPSKPSISNVKHSQSMGNLTSRPSSEEEESPDRPLAPKTRSRKSSTGNAYTPPHTSSRTQQKLMLQRASSNIEPQNMVHPLGSGGYGSGLVGSGIGYDGKDPRIKAQLDRTGLEYLVVRRYQDPVGYAIKRLDKLPGAAKNRKIPPGSSANSVKSKTSDGAGKGKGGNLGLSQSLTSMRKSVESSRGSDGRGKVGSFEARSDGDAVDEDGGVTAILRSLWEKNFDFSSSAD